MEDATYEARLSEPVTIRELEGAIDLIEDVVLEVSKYMVAGYGTPEPDKMIAAVNQTLEKLRALMNYRHKLLGLEPISGPTAP